MKMDCSSCMKLDVNGFQTYRFINEPSDALRCQICLEVAREPVQHENCGKLFCQECIEKHGKKRSCPSCQNGSRYFLDRKSRLTTNCSGHTYRIPSINS